MRLTTLVLTGSLALALGAMPDFAIAQGKGQAKGQGREDVVTKGRGQSGQTPAKGSGVAERGRSDDARAAGTGQGRGPRMDAPRARGRFVREIALSDVPARVRDFASSNRRSQVVAAGALARAQARGVDDGLRIVPAGNRVRVTNRRGDVLVDLDEDRARNLGAWNVNVLTPEARGDGPSFCRSGAGHPVWGRQWCIDKGFGLGASDVRWGRTTNVGDIIFGRRADGDRLVGSALIGFLGNTVFDRLALHALTLGYADPLTGVWVSRPTEPQLLMVNSGSMPVGELVDVNRDGRADLMLVALRPW